MHYYTDLCFHENNRILDSDIRLGDFDYFVNLLTCLFVCNQISTHDNVWEFNCKIVGFTPADARNNSSDLGASRSPTPGGLSGVGAWPKVQNRPAIPMGRAIQQIAYLNGRNLNGSICRANSYRKTCDHDTRCVILNHREIEVDTIHGPVEPVDIPDYINSPSAGGTGNDFLHCAVNSGSASLETGDDEPRAGSNCNNGQRSTYAQAAVNQDWSTRSYVTAGKNRLHLAADFSCYRMSLWTRKNACPQFCCNH